MRHSRMRLRDDARGRILAGATALADALRPTLGPKSKCVLIERKWGSPLVCNDGVTIAKEVGLKKTGDTAGDGTTTATLPAHAILSEGVRNIVAGASAIDLKRGLDGAHRAASEALAALSRPCATRREQGTEVRRSRRRRRTTIARSSRSGSRSSPAAWRSSASERRPRRSAASSGFDAARGEYVDLVEAGIVDPTKVVRIALESAVSVAGILLLTEVTLTEVEPSEKTAERDLE